MATLVNSGGKVVDFQKLLYSYLITVEGYRRDVYKDIYGNLTVGLGHKVMPADNLKLGDKIPDYKILQLFQSDYHRLNIDVYVNDNQKFTTNQRLAIASFVWSHGDGQYKSSNFRALLQGSPTKQQVADNLATWDKSKPKNQARNKKDFDLFFTAADWSPSADVSEIVKRSTPFFVVGLAVYLIWTTLRKTRRKAARLRRGFRYA